MVRDSTIPPDSFDEILAWFNADREVAATIYVQLRHALNRIFTWNRCSDSEGLTDEAIDRVAKNVHQLRQTFEGDPRLYFYGVARNLIKENRRIVMTQTSLEENDPAAPISEVENETAIMREECLHSCLQKVSSEQRELILSYYAKEKQAKIAHRIEMARRLGISPETLRVRTYRIRAALEQCVERCLNRKE